MDRSSIYLSARAYESFLMRWLYHWLILRDGERRDIAHCPMSKKKREGLSCNKKKRKKGKEQCKRHPSTIENTKRRLAEERILLEERNTASFFFVSIIEEREEKKKKKKLVFLSVRVTNIFIREFLSGCQWNKNNSGQSILCSGAQTSSNEQLGEQTIRQEIEPSMLSVDCDCPGNSYTFKQGSKTEIRVLTRINEEKLCSSVIRSVWTANIMKWFESSCDMSLNEKNCEE